VTTPNIQSELNKAANHLSANDPLLAPIIQAAGLPDFVPHRDYYAALVNSIIGQQLSVKAAAAIKQRFAELFGGKFPSPEEILTKSGDELRAIGFSYAKGRYVHDLAQHIIDGKVRFDKLDEQTNDEIIAELTDVKGIGEWTVHMFLMFCMGRLEVLPVGDLGIRNGIRAIYGFKDLPSPEQILQLAEKNKWHPYESAASWYIWHSLDNAPK
jgi:DNA-3-methyladenine glycosylase II